MQLIENVNVTKAKDVVSLNDYEDFCIGNARHPLYMTMVKLELGKKKGFLIHESLDPNQTETYRLDKWNHHKAIQCYSRTNREAHRMHLPTKG